MFVGGVLTVVRAAFFVGLVSGYIKYFALFSGNLSAVLNVAGILALGIG